MQSIMRREFFKRLGGLSLTALVAHSAAAAEPTLTRAEGHRLLRQGGVALILRHGLTDPGVGDPPGFMLDVCATQRNLSVEGRQQLTNMADRNKRAGVRFARVYTSQWCRARDTAKLLAQPGAEIIALPPLNSSFGDNVVVPNAHLKIQALLSQLPGNEAWLLVTHQVNIAALTGASPVPGEGVLVRISASGLSALGRLQL
jgi:phosphohistidine phosphatase SixA